MKYIGVIVAVVLALLGLAIGYGALQQKTENVTEEVVQIKTEVDKNEDRVVELEKFSVRQMMFTEQQAVFNERVTEVLEK